MRGSAATDVSASTCVVRLVAEREAVDAVRLDPPLGDVVDPDTLDTPFADSVTCDHVCFDYCR